MKKILLGLAVLVLLATFSACDKLELAPEDNFGSNSFWKNSAQVDGAMTGLFWTLRNSQFNLYALGEMRAGTLRDGTGGTGTSSLNSGALVRNEIREGAPGISGWAGFYSNIFQVNNFIFQVEKSTFLTDADKGYYLGQAYGLRAFYYFHLFRTFGRVPLNLKTIGLEKPLNSIEEAYLARSATEKETLDQIKSDIDKSVTNFAGNYTIKFQRGQWSLPASLMLKSEIYLWSAKVNLDGKAPTNTTADLATARAAVEDVIPRFALQSNYSDVFNYSKKGNNEIIFAIRYQLNEASNFYGQFIYQQSDNMSAFTNASGGSLVPNQFGGTNASDPLTVSGSGSLLRYEYKYNMFAKYETADTRAKVTFFDYYKAPIATNKYVFFTKFLGTLSANIRNYVDDIPVYRLSEAYLILAEIKNKQGVDPSADINKVRQRAYGTSPYPVFVSGSFEQNELAILEERDKELVGEGKRWYDLRRMQDASGSPLVFRKDIPLVGVLDKTTESHKLLWPIDKSTLTEDPKLTNDQNPGYPGT